MNTTSHLLSERPHADRAFAGHPKGLGYLSFAEGWERFSYYSMQTLLVLYMVRQLLLPGHIEHIAGFAPLRAALEQVYGGPLSTIELASAIFGLYAGLVYLTPIAGGVIADRWIGKTWAVTSGAVLMTVGHFLMAFEVSFLIALACLLIGVGLFKGNIASQVGELYAPDDIRRADAFQIYYIFINSAVIVAPLISGTLGESYGWHYGFGAAGVGMVVSLVVYLSGRKWLPAERVPSRVTAAPKKALTRREIRALIVLLLLLPVLAIGSVGNMEIYNAYLLWVPSHVDLTFFGHTMPATWLVTIDAAASLACLAGAVAFWRGWSKRYQEPSEIVKITIGIGIAAVGVLALVAAAVSAAAGHKASPVWILLFELLNSIGFANMFPVGLALYARASPARLAGTMMGVYYIQLFLANTLVGWLGGLVERLPGPQFWLLHAALEGCAALLLAATAGVVGRVLAPKTYDAEGEAA
ncbi:MAG TPA: peptide MFS transporter [Steroidobacteraceae bacterium]|nr:peptide MFS transporter [Steroidobacteraceae bacterium]